MHDLFRISSNSWLLLRKQTAFRGWKKLNFLSGSTCIRKSHTQRGLCFEVITKGKKQCMKSYHWNPLQGHRNAIIFFLRNAFNTIKTRKLPGKQVTVEGGRQQTSTNKRIKYHFGEIKKNEEQGMKKTTIYLWDSYSTERMRNLGFQGNYQHAWKSLSLTSFRSLLILKDHKKAKGPCWQNVV